MRNYMVRLVATMVCIGVYSIPIFVTFKFGFTTGWLTQYLILLTMYVLGKHANDE
jgi:hypothetical protein